MRFLEWLTRRETFWYLLTIWYSVYTLMAVWEGDTTSAIVRLLLTLGSAYMLRRRRALDEKVGEYNV